MEGEHPARVAAARRVRQARPALAGARGLVGRDRSGASCTGRLYAWPVPDKPTRADLAAARREELIQTAVRHFAAKGFEGTNLADVAAEAGVTKGLLYHYFGSKRDLFLAGLRVLDLDTILEAFPAVVEGSTLSESVALIADEWLEVFESHEGELALLVTAAVTGNEEASSRVAGLLAAFEDRIADAIAAAPDVDPKVNAPMAGAVFVAGLVSLMVRGWLSEGGRDIKAYTRQLVRMTVKGLSVG